MAQTFRRRSLAERFWEKVVKDGPTQPHMTTPCWLWTGAKSKNGYGSIGSGGKHGITKYAHVVAFELQVGVIPLGLMVLHECDVKLCVRHLYLGNHAQNVEDRQNRGRTSSGARHSAIMKVRAARGETSGARKHPERLPRGESHYSHTHPELVLRGENQPNAKLTSNQVLSIRRESEEGASGRALSSKYGISEASVSMITNYKRWKHLGVST